MLSSTMLEVAIGLAVVFGFLALIVTTLRETIESVVKSRSRNLESAIREMLGDEDAAKVYTHPLVSGLYLGSYIPPATSDAAMGDKMKRGLRRSVWRKRPSYIPSRTFALAMLDTVGTVSDANVPTVARTAVAYRHVADKAATPTSKGAPALKAALGAARLDPDRSVAEVADWYNGVMDRASGWYKRETQFIVLILSLGFALLFKVDAITLAKRLYKDPGVRAALVARAGTVGSTTVSDSISLNTVRTEIDKLDFPIGPSDAPLTRESLVGILVSTFAIALGAPFWFDLLNKLMVIRSTVKPREKSQDEGSEDRAPNNVQRMSSGAPPTGAVAAGFPPRQEPKGPGGVGEIT